MRRTDFRTYAQQLAHENKSYMFPVIEKELLHYEILRAMSSADLLSGLTFQGGTSLRLCYGSQRHSEDLDFTGGLDFNQADLRDLKTIITTALPQDYNVEARVKEPKDATSLVQRWKIVVDTTPLRPDIESQRISVEVAAIPSYTKELRPLRVNYYGVPESYGDIIVLVESLEEILADKMLAFVVSSHIRYRDLWDMFWIMRRPRVNQDKTFELRDKKEIDYEEAGTYETNLVRIDSHLDSIVNDGEFEAQMRRFLPADAYEESVARPMFREALINHIRELYNLSRA